MTKDHIRKEYKARRKSLSEQEKSKKDDLLLIQFQKMKFGEVKALFNYLSVEELVEPNTTLFARYMQFLFPHLQLAYPKTNFRTNEMNAILIDDNTIFTPGKYNILEPESSEMLHPQEIDIVFVPLLSFDKEGFRVGYGKGLYDKFLSQCRKDVMKIGFSYFPPLEKIDDLHENDIPLNFCITCDRIYEF